MDKLEQLTKQLANERADLRDQLAAIDGIMAEFEGTKLGKELALAKKLASINTTVIQDTEDDIKSLALASYDGTNKKLTDAVSIKTFTVVSYDQFEMKSWAIKHNHPAMLNLNKAACNKVAKGPTAPDFVTVEDEDRAQIKGDLSAWVTQ